MPIRKIPKNYRSVTGTFASIKNNRNIFYESLLERDFFLSLEFDSTVKSYEEQPLRIQYNMYGKRTNYTPDCLVHYNNGEPSCIVEVKFSNEIKEKKLFLLDKFEQIENYLANNDMNFKLFTENNIDKIYLHNIKFIYNYSVLRNKSKIEYFKKELLKYSKISYQNFLTSYSTNKFDQAEAIPYVWYLVLINYLEVDLYKPICKDTILKVVI
ncbi:TnsA endonuclease N-terminal domain-containing protein [Aliarcobacter butzleri]